MQPPSPRARALLGAYREATAASDALRDGLRERLDAELETPQRENARPRAWIMPAAAALSAIAAAVLLWIGKPDHSSPTTATERDHAAPFVLEDAADPANARSGIRTTDPGSATGEMSASDDEADALEPTAVEHAVPREVAPRSPRTSAAPERVDAQVEGLDLAAEMAVLRRAGAFVRSGDGPRALAALEEHQRRFPSGQLVEDREALRVQALCVSGDAAAAKEAARAFEAEHPSSPHLRRVRSAATCVTDTK